MRRQRSKSRDLALRDDTYLRLYKYTVDRSVQEKMTKFLETDLRFALQPDLLKIKNKLGR